MPQNRRRTIGIAFDRQRYSFDFEVSSSDPRVKRQFTVAEAIGHLPPLAAGESHASLANHRARALSDLNLKRISCAPPGASNEYLRATKYGDLSLACHARLESKNGKRSFSDTYTRMKGDDVAPTITTKSMSISNGRFGHYDTTQNRALTPREAALLQTFPARYVFHPEGNIEFAATLIGNAAPPQACYLFRQVLNGTLATIILTLTQATFRRIVCARLERKSSALNSVQTLKITRYRRSTFTNALTCF